MQKNHLSLVIILLTAVSCTANECYSCNKSSQVLLNPITEREAIDRARCLSTCVDKVGLQYLFITHKVFLNTIAKHLIATLIDNEYF